MKERKNTTEIDFTDQIKQLEADEKSGYPPNCNEGYEEKDGKCTKKESEASEEKERCNNESCGDCDCDKTEATEATEATAEKAEAEHYEDLEGHDMECPSCGCALGTMYLKAGLMRRSMYASKYSELYQKVKAADPQHDPEKMPEIKTTFESKRKIEDHPNAVLLRDVDGPLGKDEDLYKKSSD